MRPLFIALLVALAGMPPAMAQDGPPPVDGRGYFVDEGACPFECCRYGAWTPRRDVALYDTPEGVRIIAVACAGHQAEALTGRVLTRPIPVEVLMSPDPLPATLPLEPGRRLYLLTYLGEGFHKFWKDGAFGEIDLTMMTDKAGGFARCEAPMPACWCALDPWQSRIDEVWWVQLRLPDGTLGWSDRTVDFDGKDGCG